MNMITHQVEQPEIQAVIREYQQQGYDVITLADIENLPEFFKDYQPDLLLKKADEMVVVEVRTRSTLKDPHLPHLAQAIEPYPNWRLDLRVFRQAEQHKPISVDEIRDRFNRTRQLMDLGQFEAALLMIGSAIEATLRTVCDRENISTSAQESSAFVLLKTIVSLGLLESTDYKCLHTALELRDNLAHGLHLPQDHLTLVYDQAFMGQLLEIVERLLSSAQTLNT